MQNRPLPLPTVLQTIVGEYLTLEELIWHAQNAATRPEADVNVGNSTFTPLEKQDFLPLRTTNYREVYCVTETK